MKRPRIYQPQALQPGTTLTLDDTGFNHAIRVLRLSLHDECRIFNGQGGEYSAHITQLSRKNATVFLGNYCPDNHSSALDIHLGQVMSRGDRMDFVVQKATELGVTTITPLFSERCEVRLNKERLHKKHQHWQHTAISACEQCGLNRIPNIITPMTLNDWLASTSATHRWILHPHSPQAISPHKTTPAIETPTSCAVLIGPEGGFSNTEVSHAQQHRFNALTLGPRILRTETAPIVALSLLQYQWGDFRSLENNPNP